MEIQAPGQPRVKNTGPELGLFHVTASDRPSTPELITAHITHLLCIKYERDSFSGLCLSPEEFKFSRVAPSAPSLPRWVAGGQPRRRAKPRDIAASELTLTPTCPSEKIGSTSIYEVQISLGTLSPGLASPSSWVYKRQQARCSKKVMSRGHVGAIGGHSDSQRGHERTKY